MGGKEDSRGSLDGGIRLKVHLLQIGVGRFEVFVECRVSLSRFLVNVCVAIQESCDWIYSVFVAEHVASHGRQPVSRHAVSHTTQKWQVGL